MPVLYFYHFPLLVLSAYFVARQIVESFEPIQRLKIRLGLNSVDPLAPLWKRIPAKLLNCQVCCTGWAALAGCIIASVAGHYPHGDWLVCWLTCFAAAGAITVGERAGWL